MNPERKKRSRVQGGWAAPTNVRSDRNKPKAGVSPAWTGKTVDQPTEKKFVFEEPDEELKERPAELVITKTGVYDISTEPSGVSRLRYFPEFIGSQEANELYDRLFHDLPWRQRSDMKDGVSYLQPRLTTWYGDLSYSYSGVTHEATLEWDPTLHMLRERLESVLGLQFNSVLTNLYRDGHEHVPWHCDDERSLGPQPTIASLSFGDTRNFELRKKPETGDDYSHSEHVRIPLTHGSLLIMEGSVQDDWQHRIPREYHDRDPRINLTYRVILPE
ncbi:alpha-ketoglutarate-dependent dioxygenase alkB homolog 3-like [Mizuhopecten yessoensis]|uniref:Alpha-ketoglutarate-dependent dioxygenase alkB homolog 3 n=1 Tax=Mizuhopecten yessoensis TaxID=6573 RepID=A0A210Q8D7_MIZYE|nr:alpha-ketoglutarate-dependent dioxygenase alkB homolog 3-like [Mizuhopecten yessoensis]OWF45010.1 Alpha-ketoglutarate-dependent dioxygenase alkB-like 3 [Mizuhopecten yessoensis]